jgi:hypothetical protein
MRLGRPADSFIAYCRLVFFYFKIIFIQNFLKMVPFLARFSSGFPPGAGFPGEDGFHGFLGAPALIRTRLEQPHFSFAGTLWSRISWRA